MNYNNNNLNPTSGYWNLGYRDPSYNDVYNQFESCKTKYMYPIADNKIKIDASFDVLKTNVNDFNSFINNFSKFSDYSITGSPSDPKAFCDSLPSTGTTSLNDTSFGIYFPSYTLSGKKEKEVCNDFLTKVTIVTDDISNGIAIQKRYLDGSGNDFKGLTKDSSCNSIDYSELQKQYLAMIKTRQDVDYTLNQNNKRNLNSFVQTNLQETDILIYTGVIWMVLGTSALYLSFRYLNE